jgi:dTDP-4-dehydrorhamnose 3,5-epimerase
MIFTETKLAGAFIIDLERRSDSRGFFARSFCQREFAEHGLNVVIAQANVAFNASRGTLRGMHFQFPPAAESKVVKVTHGAILDVIVDLRPESDTYLEHISVELTADSHRSLYIPERFGHGFQVLAPETETTYLMGEFFAPQLESGIRYCDPRLGIEWWLPPAEMSPRDLAWPLLDAYEPELRRRMLTASSNPV